jgi:hypothetical protein
MPKNTTTRRSFLKKIIASLSYGIASINAGKLLAQGTQSAADAPSQLEAQGYRETEHIRSYYDTVRH